MLHHEDLDEPLLLSCCKRYQIFDVIGGIKETDCRLYSEQEFLFTSLLFNIFGPSGIGQQCG